MAENRYYVKLSNDATFWLVEDGKRLKLEGPDDWWHYGLLPVVIIEPDELDAIPLVGDEPDEEPEPEPEDEEPEDE